MTTKTYELRASAVRAAKKAGLAPDQFEVVQVWEDGGKSHWEWKAKATTATEPAPVDTAPAAAPVASTEPAPTPASPAPATEAKPEVVKASKSTVEKPTRAVWTIADEMKAANPNATRKEIVDECLRRGIAFYTARTQYQRWAKSKKSAA